MNLSLADRCIAVPESRQLNVLAKLIERRGARVLRCPLVGIVDSPEVAEVVGWLNRFVADPPTFFVAMTGEGIRRLLGFANEAGIDQRDFAAALRRTHIVARGPKPGRELRVLGVRPDTLSSHPTTDGVIQTLSELPIQGQRVAVQRYGDDPNLPLTEFLKQSGCEVEPVAPYRYAAELSRGEIQRLINRLNTAEVHAIVFTSMAQVKRLFKVAQTLNCSARLLRGLDSTIVAAVGPLVAGALEDQGCRVDLMPPDRFFMKPLVQLLAAHFGGGPRSEPRLNLTSCEAIRDFKHLA
ncbi:MAG: uroporphyrinogen-III synthase [Pseudomonadota bacterium]